ncbi:hypothetical protein GC170_15540 [bacterium]|nr:hypothetical protein [bacterium]
MAASKTHKALLVSQMIDQLKSAFPDVAELPRLELVESVLFAILRENRNSTEAMQSLARFKTDYEDDFNELRVSGLREILRKIGPSSDAEARARSIRKFLHQIFDKNYKFQIDGLSKKPFKEARDDLKDYEILANDHHMAYVQVQSLGGHAFPVDARILETARRLGVVDSSADAATLRGLLEKNIPKAQILHAIALVERFVNEICLADSPRCKDCPFQKICPFHLGLTQVVKPAKAAAPPATSQAKADKIAPAAELAKKPKQVDSARAVSVPTSPKSGKDHPAAPTESSTASKATGASSKPDHRQATAQAAPAKKAAVQPESIASGKKSPSKSQAPKPSEVIPVVESKPAKSAKSSPKPAVKPVEKAAIRPTAKSPSAQTVAPVSKSPAAKPAKPAANKARKS